MNSQYLPVACFGKLPCYTEYLEENISFPTSRALKNWIHEGRSESRLGSGDEDSVEEKIHRRFLFGLPGSVELAVGVIRPSKDQGGTRSFPFMLLTHIPRRQYGKNYSLLPLALAPVWDAIDDAWQNLANLESRAAFKEVLESTLIPAPAPVDDVKGPFAAMQAESPSRIFDGHERDSPAALKRNFPEFLKRLSKGGEPPMVELPVAGDLPEAAADVAFWLEALNRQFFWKRYEPSLFVEGAPAKKNRQVLMVFGNIRPQDYASILGSAQDAGGVVRPARYHDADGSARDDATECGRTFAELMKGL